MPFPSPFFEIFLLFLHFEECYISHLCKSHPSDLINRNRGFGTIISQENLSHDTPKHNTSYTLNNNNHNASRSLLPSPPIHLDRSVLEQLKEATIKKEADPQVTPSTSSPLPSILTNSSSIPVVDTIPTTTSTSTSPTSSPKEDRKKQDNNTANNQQHKAHEPSSPLLPHLLKKRVSASEVQRILSENNTATSSSSNTVSIVPNMVDPVSKQRAIRRRSVSNKSSEYSGSNNNSNSNNDGDGINPSSSNAILSQSKNHVSCEQGGVVDFALEDGKMTVQTGKKYSVHATKCAKCGKDLDMGAAMCKGNNWRYYILSLGYLIEFI